MSSYNAALPWADGRTRPLSRRKGLSNEHGENNCFLNVIIQSLWHVRSCRVLISMGDHAVHHRCGGDVARAGQHTATTSTSSSTPCLLCELEQIFILYQFSEEPVLDVDRVRVALSDVFALGDMNDATETLEAILDALHWDTLTRMLAIRHSHNATQRDALSQSMKDDASAIVCEPMCIAHLVFQMNLMELRTCGACSETAEPMMHTDFLYRVYAQELLTIARTSTSGADTETLEDVLRLEAQRSNGPADFTPTCDACSATQMDTSRWILTLPMVFAVSVIWASDRASKRDVSAWLELLTAQSGSRAKPQQTLHLGRVFRLDTPDVASDYSFRGMVCYYGRHYVGFFASRSVVDGVEREHWYLFDDTRVKLVGTWKDVRSRVARGGYQPTLLFYERNGLDQTKLEATANEIHKWWKETADETTDDNATSTAHAVADAALNKCDDREDKMELLKAMRASLRLREQASPPPLSQLPTSPIASAATRASPRAPQSLPSNGAMSNWHDDDLHRMQKAAEETLLRLNGILSKDRTTGAPSSITGADAAADLRRTMSMSMRRSVRKRDYSFRSSGPNAPIVNRDEIFYDIDNVVAPSQTSSSLYPPLSPIRQGIPETMYGFDESKRRVPPATAPVAAAPPPPGATSPLVPSTPSRTANTTPQANDHARFHVFDVALHASDGGVGLVLKEASAAHLALLTCDRAFVVAGFEVNGAGDKLAAEASGAIAVGDVLVAINGHVLERHALVDVLEMLWTSPNPVALVFHRFKPWACVKCTLENPANVITCNACGYTVALRNSDASGSAPV